MITPLAKKIVARLAALAPDDDARTLRLCAFAGECVAVRVTGSEILPRSTARQAGEELVAFADAADALERAAREVSYRGAGALAMGGGLHQSPRGLLAAIKVGTGRTLPEWAADARAVAAGLAESPRDQGGKVKVREGAVAAELARAYWSIVGKRPTYVTNNNTSVLRGPFVDLVRDVFEIAGLPRKSVSYAVRKAVKNLGR